MRIGPGGVLDMAARNEPHRPVRQWHAILTAACLMLSACGGPARMASGPASFEGGVVADEPRAALVARDILAQGGSAADAAAALGLALAVTLPSRAGLGGGGACVMRSGRDPDAEDSIFFSMRKLQPAQPPIGVAFLPGPLGASGTGAPALARGMAAIQARSGRLRWEQVVAPAETLARFGIRVSRALANDIAASGIVLGTTDGKPLKEGDRLAQPGLAASLAAIRLGGAGALYAGPLATSYAQSLGLEAGALRNVAAAMKPAASVPLGDDLAYVTPSAGGAFAQAILAAATRDSRADASDDAERGAAVAEAAAKAASRFPAARATDGGDTGSTGFVVVDRTGASVVCSLTMGKPFGVRRKAGETGILAAAPVSPDSAAALGVSALLVANDNTNSFKGAFAAGRGVGAPEALVQVALATLAVGRPLAASLAARRVAAPASGGAKLADLSGTLPAADPETAARVNAAACPGSGLPDAPENCVLQPDPHGDGLSAIALGR
jgi:gamma-glutamyltranspeptidase/glutathione hydrolase